MGTARLGWPHAYVHSRGRRGGAEEIKVIVGDASVDGPGTRKGLHRDLQNALRVDKGTGDLAGRPTRPPIEGQRWSVGTGDKEVGLGAMLKKPTVDVNERLRKLADESSRFNLGRISELEPNH